MFIFGTGFELVFVCFWDRIKRAQDGPKKTIKSLKGPKILLLQKPQQTIGFSKVLEVKGHSKQPWRGQKGSQEAPVELQDLKKGVQK